MHLKYYLEVKCTVKVEVSSPVNMVLVHMHVHVHGHVGVYTVPVRSPVNIVLVPAK